MDSADKNQPDAQYYLTLAHSMIDDLYNHADVIEKSKEELEEEFVKAEKEDSLLSDLKVIFDTKGKESSFKHEVAEIEKSLQVIMDTLYKADKLDPNARSEDGNTTNLRASAYHAAGYCYFFANKLKLAKDAYEQSINSKPTQAALYSYAVVLEMQGGWGSKAKVREALQKVVEFDPHSVLGLEAAKKLARM